MASPACAEVEADRALSGLTCLNRLFRLIQMLELSRFLWCCCCEAAAAGTGPGPRTFLVRGPALFHGNRGVKQVGEGGVRCWRTLLDALGVGDAWDVNDDLRVGDALDIACDGRSLLVCTRGSDASHANPLIGTRAS